MVSRAGAQPEAVVDAFGAERLANLARDV